MTNDWLAPDALVVAVDYATMVAAEVARDAALFLVDERGQFLANRDAGQFDGYPDPTATIGEAILDGPGGARPRPRRRDAPRRRPRRRDLRERDPARAEALGIGDGAAAVTDRPRGGRRRDDGRLDRAARAAGRPRRHPDRRVRGRQLAGDVRATRPGSSARPRRRTSCTRPGRCEARDAWIELGRETYETRSTSRAGRIWFAHHEDGFEATSAATLRRPGHPGRAPDAGGGRRALAADHVVGPAVRRLRTRGGTPDGASRGRRRRPPVRRGRRPARARLGASPGRADGRRLLDVETGDGARHAAGTVRLRRRAVAAAALPGPARATSSGSRSRTSSSSARAPATGGSTCRACPAGSTTTRRSTGSRRSRDAA